MRRRLFFLGWTLRLRYCHAAFGNRLPTWSLPASGRALGVGRTCVADPGTTVGVLVFAVDDMAVVPIGSGVAVGPDGWSNVLQRLRGDPKCLLVCITLMRAV